MLGTTFALKRSDKSLETNSKKGGERRKKQEAQKR